MLRNCWRVLLKWIAKINQKEFRVEKVIKKKCDKLYVKWKSYIVLLTTGLMKKIYMSAQMSEYLSEPKSSGGKLN